MDTNYTSRDLATATTTATATPANPLLASSFLTTSDLTALLKDQTHPAASTAPEEQETHPPNLHIPTLDSALAAPFHSGTVVALSSASPSPRNGVAQTLLVDCLFRSGDSGVAVVDTTGDFDVVGLYARILRRVDEQCFVFESGGGDGEVDVQKRKEGRAAELLDRVRILRVFDFVGVREAIGELSGELEGRRGGGGGGSGGGEESGDGSVVAEEENKKVVVDGEEAHAPPPRRTEVADSEDEEGDDELETQDEEMLFDIEEQTTEETSAPAPVSLHSTPHTTSQRNTWQPNIAEKPSPPKLNLILIDNLAHVLLPLLKKDSIQGTSLLTSFLSTLAALTRTHKLHTLLLNPCINGAPRAGSPTSGGMSLVTTTTAAAAPPGAQQQQQQQNYAPAFPPPPSIFTSQHGVPALLGLLRKAGRAGVLRGERGWGEEKKKKNKGGGDGVCD
ncbi:uncharacterized protein EKO05_0003347 [Ascochyta rabiei]|uniref:uncharacterized protein n=1 Tax=Didymella rabiei TaxID=5454 RepID=UPI0022040965|nr:uncharacterized protein EKO05_0003347 [Ascochyta rabiei]UPX12811.1 hypothetical protein EKO05_0003347 [Ascochyta rabiei]